MIFFTADEHYEHENILRYCSRPFASAEECREKIIENHNRVVKPGDFTYHLGDVVWRTCTIKLAQEILRRLNGKHFLIWGNHDEVARQVAGQFEWTKDCVLIKPGTVPPIWLSHYSHRVWPESHKGSWHLYGHSHGELPGVGKSFDVGVDCNGYTPVSLQQVSERMFTL